MDRISLVYAALGLLLLTAFVTAWVLVRTPNTDNAETRRLRFAAVTFTGILMLFVFTAILYFADSNTGKDIFEKAVTAMTPLAGTIIGYLFASRGNANN
jgi:hypothetical protein